MKSRPVIGLTMGDPAGIGPEICLRALAEPSVLAECVPVLFGDAGVINRVLSHIRKSRSAKAKSRGKKAKSREEIGRVLSLGEWEQETRTEKPAIVDCNAVPANLIKIGKVSPACGRAGYIYIEQAIQSAMRGQIAAVATAPIHKEALRLAGVKQPGHTEIFTDLTGAKRSCMMLRSELLTVSMVTTHIGYADVPKTLSIRRVLDVIELTAAAMRRALKRPARLGICGLNPHAGEHGLFGRREEERFVIPAVIRAKEQGINIEGPLPPDTAFTVESRKRFDAMVTLYHDQGHIPFKMLGFETGVNITLGLPMVRTSVDHGTAFDIAWRGLADPRSMFAAIHAGVELAGRRE